MQVTPRKAGEELIQLRVEVPKPVEGMRPTGTLPNSGKTNVKSCTWEAKPLAVLQAGNEPVAGSSAENTLGVIMNSKLSMGQQCEPATASTNCTLSCMNRRRTHSGNQDKYLFPFIHHSLDHYETTLSDFGPIHIVNTLIKRREFCKSNSMIGIWILCPVKRGWGTRT